MQQQAPIAAWLLGGFLITLVLGMLYATWRGIRDGRRLPPMPRSQYRRSVPLLLLAPIGLFLLVFAGATLTNSNIFFYAGCLAFLAFPLFHYHIVRRGVQRFSDIQGETYIGFWRALYCSQPSMIFYLCLRRGRALPPINPDIF
jgi:hypothetical protein